MHFVKEWYANFVDLWFTKKHINETVEVFISAVFCQWLWNTDIVQKPTFIH